MKYKDTSEFIQAKNSAKGLNATGIIEGLLGGVAVIFGIKAIRNGGAKRGAAQVMDKTLDCFAEVEMGGTNSTVDTTAEEKEDGSC
jgi:hypothetical protein